MPNIFKDGGGAGIGSYVVVFKDGQLAENTDFLKLRGAYEAGESIFFSIVDEETKDAMVPASGWIDEESKMHLIARDFDDDKTYVVVVEDAPIESEIHVEAEVKEGIELGEGEIQEKLEEDSLEEGELEFAIGFDSEGNLIKGAGAEGGAVSLDGTSLVIPEQPAPEPVITIDGVAYYHKQEFDLEEMVNLKTTKRFNILTGEEIDFENFPFLYLGLLGPGGIQPEPWGIDLKLDIAMRYTIVGTPYSPSNFTSRAFTVVDAQEEVTDNTKICLPTCSAYYGFLSEDGKTFISYYNLKSDAPEFVDSIKQGENIIPISISARGATAGQMLMTDGKGGTVWSKFGTLIAKHEFTAEELTTLGMTGWTWNSGYVSQYKMGFLRLVIMEMKGGSGSYEISGSVERKSVTVNSTETEPFENMYTWTHNGVWLYENGKPSSSDLELYVAEDYPGPNFNASIYFKTSHGGGGENYTFVKCYLVE